MYRRGESGMGDGDETAPVGEPAAEEQSDEHVKAFFLDLAAKGKEAWNTWRRDPANKDVRVTFAGIDFRETPRDEIGFSGFEFGDNANFSGCKWQRVYFDEASFGHDANFSGATFDHRVYFRATTFGHFAEFSNATFGDELANFAGATFGDGTLFGSGSFVGESAIFRGARFASFVDFSGATFNPMASLEGAIFRGPADFSGLSGSFLYRGCGHGLILSCSFENQRRQTLGCRARTVAGSREAVFPTSYIPVI
jgi:uncharacterized protein YjbI with pentapeptide repeats